MEDILTDTACETILVYEINVNYVNMMTFDDEDIVSLKFQDDVVDQVGNRTDEKSDGRRQSHTLFMDAGSRYFEVFAVDSLHCRSICKSRWVAFKHEMNGNSEAP